MESDEADILDYEEDDLDYDNNEPVDDAILDSPSASPNGPLPRSPATPPGLSSSPSRVPPANVEDFRAVAGIPSEVSWADQVEAIYQDVNYGGDDDDDDDDDDDENDDNENDGENDTDDNKIAAVTSPSPAPNYPSIPVVLSIGAASPASTETVAAENRNVSIVAPPRPMPPPAAPIRPPPLMLLTPRVKVRSEMSNSYSYAFCRAFCCAFCHASFCAFLCSGTKG